VHKAIVSATLMRFRLAPAAGARFPDYEAGQYITLRRDDCKLTRKTGVGPDGKPTCEPEYDPWGRQTVGPVTQPYSIASAPADTAEHGWLEFLVGIEHGVHGLSGRLSEVLFGTSEETGGEVRYQDRIAGGFTLSARARDAASVLMVGTGTGVAPFVSMVRELRARDDGGDGRRYTLIHTARTEAELACRAELFEIEAAGRFDFLYLPTVSRRAGTAGMDSRIGLGRASNVVRHVFGLPTAEEEKQTHARSDVTRVAAELALERLVSPQLPAHVNAAELAARVAPPDTVLLACGNPASVGDIESTAKRRQVRFERDTW
jgi:ferredoxin-NADP reductase